MAQGPGERVGSPAFGVVRSRECRTDAPLIRNRMSATFSIHRKGPATRPTLLPEGQIDSPGGSMASGLAQIDDRF